MNTFSVESDAYRAGRPHYPERLFDWISSSSPGLDVAWDCACGNGQAATGLARSFALVEATDVSAEQIAVAIAHPQVRYAVAPAEQTPFPAAFFDCVVVAQALHWFDLPRWWSELRRVARPGALFVGWGYDWLECPEEIDVQLVQPLRQIIAPFWAPNNRILWQGYQDPDIDFPFQRLEVPRFAIEMVWTQEQLLDYMRTWSAFKYSRSDPGAARAMDDLLARLPAGPDDAFSVRMPLKTVAGYVS